MVSAQTKERLKHIFDIWRQVLSYKILNVKYNHIYSQNQKSYVYESPLRMATNGSQVDIEYHDNEWGVPVHSDKKLFELLLLETAQAGLTWSIILKKREGYRRAFDDFDADKVANYDQRRIKQLLADPSVIRIKLKIQSAVSNAKAFIKLQHEYGSFDSYLWSFVDGKPKHNQ